MIGIVIVFIMISICAIYLYSYRKTINDIMTSKVGIDYKNIISFRDLIRIYRVFSNSKEINDYERNTLKIFFFIFIFSLILYITFACLIFWTDW
jgi:hypothetical protein